MRDLLVVGGGPVGLAAALRAADAGLDVAVLEPRSAPVDKACGEGLMPGALAAVRALGVDPPGAPITGVTYLSAAGRRADHDFTAGPGRGVRRTALQEALHARVVTAGVPVLTGRARDLVQDGAAVRVAVEGGDGPGDGPGDGRALRARWVLGCDGLHSTVRRLAGLDAGSDGRRYGVRRHAALAPWSSRVEVHWGADVEVYVTPVGPAEVGIAVLGGRGAGLDAALAQLPVLRERLAGVAWTTPPRGAGPLRQRARARSAGRVLLAGDAAGYVDALTGEGLRVGLAAAGAAVAALRAHGAGPRPAARVGEAYEAAWARGTRSYRVLTEVLLAASRPRAARAGLVPLAVAAPGLYRAAVEQLAR